MSLDRDELAARCLVARLSALNAAGAYRANADAIAENAIDCTDALLARLRPEAVAPAPSRPEWVRITGPKDAVNVTVGKAYRVIYVTDEGNLAINNDEGVARHLPRRGEYVTRVFPSWEPCAAPSPAATPAAWVPSVGDVVKQMSETDKTATADSVRVVVSTDPLRWVYVGGDATGEWCEPKGWEDEVRFVRPATAAERAAAGLPVDEAPAFDEAKEREAALDAYRAGTDGCIDPEGTKYPTCRDSFRNGWLARARVAAKGGAS